MSSAFVVQGVVDARAHAQTRSRIAARCVSACARAAVARRGSQLRMVSMDEVCEVGRKKNDGNGIKGKVFVVGENIDTDQIIPAEYLTLVPSVPDEYQKLGSYAMIGLPDKLYPTRYVRDDGSMRTDYPIIIAGPNFGCGSSREHAPIAIGACGGKAVVAESYARIFFRNCSATGELYPWETPTPLTDKFKTGDEARIDFETETITNLTTGERFPLNPLGDVEPVVDAGGLFEYARRSGMISKA
ncbi:3-isopropylmalate dehydratase small subunit 3 [Porphyridium purpureum]|uniref:3-isopropylmalate dehydratase small subunit 3 n=1 Tax=Porphyridium purpureum TaxID=35688 RepID=A0A5J4Z638_PORPP|nr:3-isopropylmalate dehydratase small subunit 3 [Porphyridium purpureum]|eukprot:POR9191..scf295_1